MTAHRAKGSGLEWFVRRGATVRGPLSSARVRHFVMEDRLGLDDEVSLDRQEWRRIADVAEVLPPQMRAQDPALDAGGSEPDSGGRAWRTLLVALLIVGGFILAVYLAGSGEDAPAIDCAADPRPAVILEGCRLAAVDWGSASLRGAQLANATLTDAVLAGADLEDADLRYVDLRRADLSYTVMRRAVLKGANLGLADLTNADLRGADLSFADLSRAQMGGARLDQADLEGTIWVDGRRCDKDDCPR